MVDILFQGDNHNATIYKENHISFVETTTSRNFTLYTVQYVKYTYTTNRLFVRATVDRKDYC